MIAVPIVGQKARELALGRAADHGPFETGATDTGMDEQEFHVFYGRTAQPLRAYLVSCSGNLSLADDLLQEAYYRFLRANPRVEDESHRRSYLFRIATNLLRDHFRRRRPEVSDMPELPGRDDGDRRVQLRSDMARALSELTPRDRQMLWLAYVEGLSHREIGSAMGLKTGSLRPMLFRARQRLAKVLREKGFTS